VAAARFGWHPLAILGIATATGAAVPLLPL